MVGGRGVVVSDVFHGQGSALEAIPHHPRRTCHTESAVGEGPSLLVLP